MCLFCPIFRRPFEPYGFTRPQHLGHYSSYNQPPSTTPTNVQRNYVPMKSINAMQLKMAGAPKSCLAKIDHSHNNSDVDETDSSSIVLHNPPKTKKVVFADDKGLELTQVKIMSEPSNVPPYWTLQFLAEVTHGLISPVAIAEQWIVDFKQPASDYLEFRCVC